MSQNESLGDQVSINADHSNLVKFHDANDSMYVLVRTRLRDCVKKAPDLIERRLVELDNKSPVYSDLLTVQFANVFWCLRTQGYAEVCRCHKYSKIDNIHVSNNEN